MKKLRIICPVLWVAVAGCSSLYWKQKLREKGQVVYTIQRSFDGKHWQDIKIPVTKAEGFQATTFVTNIPALMMRVESVESK